jgi:predicted TIM-barrel fold metal-dependent hydrolase
MIVDAHIHIYDPFRPEGVPWPRPEETLLYRTVLPRDFAAVAVPHGVRAGLVVEASPWVADNLWVLDQARREPCLVGEIGNLQPGSEGFAAEMRRLALNPLFRGIRRPCPDGPATGSRAYLDDLRLLADLDLTLDVMVSTEWEALDDLARQLPGLRMVICHLGHPRTDGRAPDRAWREGIRRVAGHPNIFLKVSGVAESAVCRPAPVDVGFYAPVLGVVWDAFGEDRVIYGSNWPVCELAASYANVLRIASEYACGKGPGAVAKLTEHNGAAAYKWIV